MDTRDKISFSLPKTLEAKEEQIREQTISISCCCCAFQPPLFSKSTCIASRILSSRANTRPSDRSSVRIEVGFVLFRNEQAKHHHRVHSKKSEEREFCNRIADKKTKKKHLSASHREQRHRVSSVDRFFAGREGHVRSSRNRFHGTLSLQAFGLGDRRFRAHVDGLDDRSHYYSIYLRAVMRTMRMLRSCLCLREKIFL